MLRDVKGDFKFVQFFIRSVFPIVMSNLRLIFARYYRHFKVKINLAMHFSELTCSYNNSSNITASSPGALIAFLAQNTYCYVYDAGRRARLEDEREAWSAWQKMQKISAEIEKSEISHFFRLFSLAMG